MPPSGSVNIFLLFQYTCILCPSILHCAIIRLDTLVQFIFMHFPQMWTKPDNKHFIAIKQTFVWHALIFENALLYHKALSNCILCLLRSNIRNVCPFCWQPISSVFECCIPDSKSTCEFPNATKAVTFSIMMFNFSFMYPQHEVVK